ncbi:MAG: hypothetical protein GSR86_02685 [Desulfurococcales archaeon]|nr:hypothetical protein [Desulfurococcales archaeon]
MLVRLVGVSILAISLTLLVTLASLTVAGVEPSITSFHMMPKISYNNQGDLVIVSRVTTRGMTQFTGSYRYTIELYTPSTLASFTKASYKVLECHLYLASAKTSAKPAYRSAVIRLETGMISPTGILSTLDPRDLAIAESQLKSLVDKHIVVKPRANSCQANITLSWKPVDVIAFIVIDDEGFYLEDGPLSLNSTMVKDIIMGESTGAPSMGNVTVTFTSPPSGGAVTTTMVKIAVPAGKVQSLLINFLHEFGAASVLTVTVWLDMSGKGLWRIGSLIVAGVLLLAYDAGRNPVLYRGRVWAPFRRLAEILGISRG